MSNARAHEMAKMLSQSGGLLDYGPDLSRLLIQVLRSLAKGRPVTGERVDQMTAGLGIARDAADQFLRQITERDADNNIVGIMGLSLKDHPHRFHLDGARMSTWCAEDTLFLPAMLQQTATVESESPLTKRKVRLTVGPEGVQEVNPPGAVVSITMIDPEKADMSSAQAIWSTFCHHVFFFASREEAERWASGRDDIEILSVGEGYLLGEELWSKVLSHV
ncbi:MAG: organomercurial lyase [Candidatus Krumholzibacteriia bacterium]